MGPTEDNKQDSAVVPSMGMPADNAAMPPAPTASVDPAAMGGTAEPNPDEVSMSDEAPAAAPEVPATPAMPAEPTATATGPDDPSMNVPGSAPQQ